MTDNKQMMSKADIAVGDLTSGGLLNPEQSDRFYRTLIEAPTILSQMRRVRMSSPQRTINKIGFGSRILKAATSGAALSSGDRSAPDLGKVTLTSKEVIATIYLPYDVIEDNIERGGVGNAQDVGGTAATGGMRDTILDLIAERVAVDLEELALQGDTGSGDTYLALIDGFVKQSSSNVVDVSAATVTKAVFKNGLKAMPEQYKRNLAQMRHFLSVQNEIEYRDTLSDRATGLGDAVIQGTNPVFGFGVPVVGANNLLESQGLLTNPQNMIFGIQRDITMESAKDIEARVYKIVVTARIDFKFEEEAAVVKYINIG